MHVHIDNLAAQTGASLFAQTHAPPYPSYLASSSLRHTRSWTYNKTEHLSPEDLTSSTHFTHVITESPKSFNAKVWSTVECVNGFDRLQVRRVGLGEIGGGDSSNSNGVLKRVPAIPIVEFVYSEKLCILERTTA